MKSGSDPTPIALLLHASGMTQEAFASFFGIPKRTVENWSAGSRQCPPYLVSLIEFRLKAEKRI